MTDTFPWSCNPSYQGLLYQETAFPSLGEACLVHLYEEEFRAHRALEGAGQPEHRVEHGRQAQGWWYQWERQR